MTKVFDRKYKQDRGFTLIELMLVLIIGSVLLTAVYGVFINSSQSYRKLQGLASIQERARIAMNILHDTIEVADYTGCRSDVAINNVLTSGAYAYNFGEGIEGFNSTGTAWSPAIDASITSPLASGGDVITVRGPVGTPARLTAAMANSSSALTVPAGSPFISSDIVMIGDCAGGADVFQKTDAGGLAVTSIAHAASGLNGSANLSKAYDTDALVVRVGTTTFYIRRNADELPSLYWIEGAGAAQELIEGVDAMEILYGVTTNTDTSANWYKTAAAVDAAGEWADVVSVRIALLIATTTPVTQSLDSDLYSLLGTAHGPYNDYRVRRVFTTNIALRNRSF